MENKNNSERTTSNNSSYQRTTEPPSCWWFSFGPAFWCVYRKRGDEAPSMLSGVATDRLIEFHPRAKYASQTSIYQMLHTQFTFLNTKWNLIGIKSFLAWES